MLLLLFLLLLLLLFLRVFHRITSGLEDVPVLHCHGEADPVIIPDWAQKTKEHLINQKGARAYELRTYTGVPHSVSVDIIRDATEFLQRILPDRPELALKPPKPSELSIKQLKEAIKRAGLASKCVGFSEKGEFVSLLEEYYRSKGFSV
jgi:Phospholipase/Carboxylesterase